LTGTEGAGEGPATHLRREERQYREVEEEEEGEKEVKEETEGKGQKEKWNERTRTALTPVPMRRMTRTRAICAKKGERREGKKLSRKREDEKRWNAPQLPSRNPSACPYPPPAPLPAPRAKHSRPTPTQLTIASSPSNERSSTRSTQRYESWGAGREGVVRLREAWSDVRKGRRRSRRGGDPGCTVKPEERKKKRRQAGKRTQN